MRAGSLDASDEIERTPDILRRAHEREPGQGSRRIGLERECSREIAVRLAGTIAIHGEQPQRGGRLRPRERARRASVRSP